MYGCDNVTGSHFERDATSNIRFNKYTLSNVMLNRYAPSDINQYAPCDISQYAPLEVVFIRNAPFGIMFINRYVP